ncbi:MAG: ABC transporter substrate-binding protein, partial [Candidatus Hodarchaeales archaeon]
FDQAFAAELEDGELVPELCTSWERLNDTTLVFNIRQGVKFHNGEEMTAEDWKFTFEKYATPPPPPPAPPPPPQFTYCQHIIDIEILGDYSIKITTDVPYGAIPDIFIMHAGNFFILPKNAVEAAGPDWQWNPIGTGPYKFVERVEGQYVKYERFDDYWRGTPNLDEIIVKQIPDPDTLINALEVGEVDVLVRVPELAAVGLVDNPDIQLWTDLIQPGGDFTAFNHRMYPTNDLRFRQAVFQAIDYDAILPIINPYGTIEQKYGFLYTYVASGAAPWAYNPAIEAEFLDYDLVEAQRLIAELQAETPIPQVKVWGWDRQEAWITYIATVLEQDLGLDVDLQIFSGPAALDVLFTQADEWHIYTMGAPTGHPIWVSAYYHSTRGMMMGAPPPGDPPPPPAPGDPPPPRPPAGNYAGYVNAQVDEWLDLAEVQISREAMANYFYLAETQAVKDVAYLWTYEASAFAAVRTDLVGDVEPLGHGGFIYLYNADHNVYMK